MLDGLRTMINRVHFRLSPKARSRLWERLGSLTAGGVPIGTAMEFLSESGQHGTAHGFVAHQKNVMRSAGFADAAIGWIPKEELLVIKLTQEGRITEGFAQAARIAKVRTSLRSTLLSGLAYPTVLLLVAGAVISILPSHALSIMSEVLDTRHWPPISKSVLVFSALLRDWGVLFLIFVLSGASLAIWSAPRWSSPLRSKLEWLPPYSLYRQFTGAEVLVAWLALMRAGVQRLRALDQLELGLPNYLASHVRTMRSRLYSGAPIESALDTGLFSLETLEDLRIYDRIGKFSERSDHIANEDIDRALVKLERTTKLISTCLLLLIAGVAIWIYVGIANVAFSIQQATYF